jgi:carbon-monoxide dehydrogenase small subunit
MNAITVTLQVNGETICETVPARTMLADFLREKLGLTGTHVGCAHGVCGACTIRVNGVAIRSCLMLAAQAEGASVETIEGLTEAGALAALQDAFHRHNAAQCGYCSPGMLVTAAELVAAGAPPDRSAIRAHMSGNYCRCTGYQAIIDAIEDVLRTNQTGANT